VLNKELGDSAVPEKSKKGKAPAKLDSKAAKKERRKMNVEIGNRWYKYQNQWKRSEQTLQKQRTEAKDCGTFFLEPEAKVLLVVRIRGINRLSPKVRKVLRLLRLRQIHNAVLIKVNKATIGMLKLVEPYVAYGYPSVATIKRMVCKRGYLKIDRQRIPLVNNEQVQEQLGHLDIKSVGCMINELYTCGDNFTAVASSLWPFKLASPRGGYSGKKRIHFVDGGSFGNQEKYINAFVAKML